MKPTELLRYVVRVLDENEIPYMITGSVASSLQGEPRATHDLDVVVVVRADDAPALLRNFAPPGFYLDEGAILEAVRTGGMFNAINLEEGDKVDFWLLTNDEFDESRFRRRIEVDVFGVRLRVSSPEDTILGKLRWSILSGGSKKSFVDAPLLHPASARGCFRREDLPRWKRERNAGSRFAGWTCRSLIRSLTLPQSLRVTSQNASRYTA